MDIDTQLSWFNFPIFWGSIDIHIATYNIPLDSPSNLLVPFTFTHWIPWQLIWRPNCLIWFPHFLRISWHSHCQLHHTFWSTILLPQLFHLHLPFEYYNNWYGYPTALIWSDLLTFQGSIDQNTAACFYRLLIISKEILQDCQQW